MKIKGLLFSFGLLCVMLTACSKESEPAEAMRADETTRTGEANTNETKEPTRTIELSLSGTVDEKQLRLYFDMDGNELPKIHLASLKNSSGKVPVQCVLRGEGGGLPTSINYVTIPFDFDETTRKLSVYKYVLSLPATAEYSNLNGRRWYVTGCIGGTLSSSDHKISFRDDYTNGKHGTNIVQDPQDVPIMFPWTEISFKESGRGDIPNVAFSLRGALLRIKWVNDLSTQIRLGRHVIYSNAFGGDGYFKLDGPVAVGEFPPYVFDNTDPGEHRIEHGYDVPETLQPNGGKGGQGYFLVWVMPRATAPANPKTYIRSNAHLTSVPNLAFPATKLRLKGGALADYTTGMPQQGKTYLLEAHIAGRPRLPIEYAEPSALSIIDPNHNYLGTPAPIESFPLGTLPTLPIPADRHIPYKYEWTAIYPPEGDVIQFRTPSHGAVPAVEQAQVGGVQATFAAEYVNTAGPSVGHEVTYAIRFAKTTSATPGYPAANNDILRCAYRYEVAHNGFIIRVRYIGEDPSIDINDVSDPTYWSKPDATEITYSLVAYDCYEVHWFPGRKYGLGDTGALAAPYWVKLNNTDYQYVTASSWSIDNTSPQVNPTFYSASLILFKDKLD